MSLIKDYKAFITKGNIVDLAVAVVIGGAFGKIITSFVKDVVMPPIGLMIGGVDFKDLKYVMQEAVMTAEGEISAAAVSINYGMFVQNMIEFLIIAWAVFLVVRGLAAAKKKEEAAPAAPVAPPAPSKEEVLLGEIRDLLKK
jgi:large conductance mechanosensitive channel